MLCAQLQARLLEVQDALDAARREREQLALALESSRGEASALREQLNRAPAALAAVAAARDAALQRAELLRHELEVGLRAACIDASHARHFGEAHTSISLPGTLREHLNRAPARWRLSLRQGTLPCCLRSCCAMSWSWGWTGCIAWVVSCNSILKNIRHSFVPSKHGRRHMVISCFDFHVFFARHPRHVW